MPSFIFVIYCRAVNTWLKVGRWIYDPKRGLRLECKAPQLPDSALKDMGYEEKEKGNKYYVIPIMSIIQVNVLLLHMQEQKE